MHHVSDVAELQRDWILDTVPVYKHWIAWEACPWAGESTGGAAGQADTSFFGVGGVGTAPVPGEQLAVECREREE